MDYNARMGQQGRYQANSRSKKKEDESDAFMRLTDKEIAGCISDIGLAFSAADLMKPNPQQIQKVFEVFADLLMNVTRETIEPAMRAAAEDVYGDFVDIVPADSRNLMGFYMSLRKLLHECGIHDFSFQDLLRPTHERLTKIFSYVINFIRFRESQTGVIDEHFDKVANSKMRIETLYAENQDMEDRLEEMKRSRKAMEGTVKEKIRRNDELKQCLLELKARQERAAERFERIKGDKQRYMGVLEERTANAMAVRQESAKLRPYVQQPASALHSSLNDLNNSLQADKVQIDSLERRARALQTSSDTFGMLTNDVISCTKLLEEVSNELHKEEEEVQKAGRHRDALSDNSNNVREIERTEALLQRQLSKWNERTDNLRSGSNQRAQGATERMEELRKLHRRLTEERGEKQREMEKRRVRIEQTEKKMADLKENIENEVHAAHDEYLKMDSHIKLYINEMEQCL